MKTIRKLLIREAKEILAKMNGGNSAVEELTHLADQLVGTAMAIEKNVDKLRAKAESAKSAR